MKSIAFNSVTAIASTIIASLSIGLTSVQAQNDDHLTALLENRTCQRCELSGIEAT